jgi:hypothetical protein
MSNRCYILNNQILHFSASSGHIRFFHLKQLRLFYIIRVTACWCRDLNIKPVLEHNTPYTGCVGEPLKYYITM